MGQRLNLEIRHKDKVLANSYYHWSAYTGSAYSLTQKCVEFITSNHANFSKDLKLLAIRALESTGAGLDEDEIERIHSIKKYYTQEFSPARDRNSGLIGISPAEIKATQDWAEGTSIIYIDDLNDIRIDFDVFCCEESEKDYIEFHDLESEEEINEFKSRIVSLPFSADYMTLGQLSTVVTHVVDLGYFVKMKDGFILSELG